MSTSLKSILLFLFLNLIFSCSENKNPAPAAPAQTAEPKPAEPKTISGTVTAVSFGKDGYTADVQTETEGTYAALVSISNMGGPQNFKSCNVGDKVVFKGITSMMGEAKQLKVSEIVSIEATQTQLLIAPNSFRGIQIGDAISKHGDYIQKKKMKTAEGTFEVYEIKDFDNNPAGYFMADPKNKLLVGDITVNSPKAQTAKGIKTGSTFGDLLKAVPEIEAHGSEIEGRTYASAGTLSYRLDMANFKYEIDRAKIPATTKITEIMINRK